MTKTETYISFIKDQLRSGIVDPGKICLLFCTKFDKTRQTFYNHWENAQIDYNKEVQEIEKQKTEESINGKIDAVKRGILTKNKALDILTKIAKGKITTTVMTKLGPENIEPSFFDMRAAIETIAKIEGWFAPTKLANTDVDGKDKQGFIIGSLSDWLKEK